LELQWQSLIVNQTAPRIGEHVFYATS